MIEYTFIIDFQFFLILHYQAPTTKIQMYKGITHTFQISSYNKLQPYNQRCTPVSDKNESGFHLSCLH